jgi:putative cardiolipin synthase
MPAVAPAGDNLALNRAYAEKLKAYEQFVQAVNDNKDEITIQKLSGAYKTALEKYNAILSKNNTDAILNNNDASNEANQSIPAETAAASGLEGISGELRNVINIVHTYKAKNDPDAVIQKLENLIETPGALAGPDEINLAKIELANVYSMYKNDYSRAVELLKEVTAGSNSGGKYYGEAVTALKRAEFHLNGSKMIAEIDKTRAEAKKLLAKYQQTPIYKPLTKGSALAGYYMSLFKYRKSIAEYRSFKHKFDKSENFTYYGFIADIFGGAQAFDGVEDAFNNSNISIRDVSAPVKHLADNVEALYARWYMLNSAKHSIDMSYFIFDKDPIGNAILGMLLKKAREGVKVRLILDAHGCGEFAKNTKSQDYLQELAAEKNAKVKIFNPVHKAISMAISDLRNLISSNHQKIIIIDGETLITGGRNISAHYLADPRDYKEAYRDTDVMVKSAELSEQLKMTFEEEFDALENFEVKKDMLGNWVKRDGELLDCARSLDSWIKGNGVYRSKKIEKLNKKIETFKHMTSYNQYEHFKGAHYAPVKLFGKNSIQQERNDITDNIIALINASSDEIIIQNPYVIFTDKAKAALKAASARGVKIIINTNSPTCFPAANGDLLTLAFFLDEWMPFLKENPTAKIYGVAIALKMHAKVFIFDRAVTVIGTYNMDPMSEDINAENVCAVNSKEFAEECRAKIFEDLSYSKEYKIGINEKGEPYEIFGPGSLGDEKILDKLRLIKKLKFLRPMI